MTNFVGQMMKTAGIEPISERCDEGGGCIGYIYPDFTAEKQLKIIKLIGDTVDFYYNGFCMSSLTEHGEDDVIEIEVENDNFAQALAQLTTVLMNAGELDKEKVREILEDAR